jgi:hypothetical protein
MPTVCCWPLPLKFDLGDANDFVPWVCCCASKANKQKKKKKTTFDQRYPQNFAQFKKILDKEVVERLVCHEY